MIFSSIIETIKIIQNAQKNGMQKQNYEISISDITSDYNAMLAFYNKQFQSAPLETKQEFKKEVNEFYLVLDRLCADNNLPPKENDNLFNIRVKTRKLKETLSMLRIPKNEDEKS